jgi:hypothetical protein
MCEEISRPVADKDKPLQRKEPAGAIARNFLIGWANHGKQHIQAMGAHHVSTISSRGRRAKRNNINH